VDEKVIVLLDFPSLQLHCHLVKDGSPRSIRAASGFWLSLPARASQGERVGTSCSFYLWRRITLITFGRDAHSTLLVLLGFALLACVDDRLDSPLCLFELLGLYDVLDGVA
jgi:hypothetical protein